MHLSCLIIYALNMPNGLLGGLPGPVSWYGCDVVFSMLSRLIIEVDGSLSLVPNFVSIYIF